MLLPAEKIENVEYRDRMGTVRAPSPDSVFKQRYGAFLICFVGEYMLLSRSEYSDGDWELPGGGIDKGESAEEAVLREAYEETGVDFGDISIEKQHSQRIYYFSIGDDQFWNYDQDYFLLNDLSLKNHIFDGVVKSPDNCDAKWIRISDLTNTDIRHDHNIVLQELGYKK